MAQAVLPEALVLLVLLLLLADCSAKAAGVAVVALLVLAVQVVLEVVALAAVAVVQRAVHTRPALVVSVVLAGLWFWSFDHAAICSC